MNKTYLLYSIALFAPIFVSVGVIRNATSTQPPSMASQIPGSGQ